MLNLKRNTSNLTNSGLIAWSAEKRYVSYIDRVRQEKRA